MVTAESPATDEPNQRCSQDFPPRWHKGVHEIAIDNDAWIGSRSILLPGARSCAGQQDRSRSNPGVVIDGDLVYPLMPSWREILRTSLVGLVRRRGLSGNHLRQPAPPLVIRT